MPFPDAPRVRYHKSPLAEVVCELRFPPILRIETELPAVFQDSIRREFPLYNRQPAPTFAPPPNMPPQIVQMMQAMVGGHGGGVRHEFVSADGQFTATLTQGSLDLKTKQYQQWEAFRAKLESLHQAVSAVYAPAFYTRVGLKYIDIIRRSLLGIAHEPWSSLLRPEVAGKLTVRTFEDAMDQMKETSHLYLSEPNEFLTLNTGIAFADTNNQTKEKCFLIDSDFHTHDRTEITDALKKLDSFNRKSGRLFRWCILERLHLALEPQSI